MVDFDTIIMKEDYKALLAYRKDKKEGKLISHEEIKRKLGIPQ